MTTERVLIASIVVLAAALGVIFGYCHGTVGFGAAYPLAGTSLQINVTTTGTPALIGVCLAILGLALLIWAVVEALLRQIPALGQSTAK